MSPRWSWDDVRGAWALVTGASEGIGRAYARALAERGLSLALVARRSEPLRTATAEIAARSGRPLKTFVQDLSVPGAAEALADRLHAEGIRPRVLVNNAGTMRWGPFSAERLPETVLLNALAPAALCAALRDDLASHPTSAVINVGSLAGEQPIPYLAAYAATKSFLKSFSVALAEEWGSQGTRVQVVLPGFVDTQFSAKAGLPETLSAKFAKSSRVSPERVVQRSLAGLARDRRLVYLSIGEKWRSRAAAGLPAEWVASFSGRMFRPSP